MRRLLLFSVLFVYGVCPGSARVMEEDDSISFEWPWEQNCQSCDGEWEPLFPPGMKPEGDTTEPVFMTMGVVDDSEPTADVPEPATWILIGGGLMAMGIWRRRRNSHPL